MQTIKEMRKYKGSLRPYQLDGVAEVRQSLANGPTLLVSPTGAGKTDMAAVIAEDYRNVLFVAHRRELLSQAQVPMGSHVVRMSIQSALRYGPKETELLIIDEAHRAKAKTYRDLIEKYSNAARLGLTATPLRTDGQGLCDAFDHMVQVSSVKELVESGHLVPYIPYGPSNEALAHLEQLKKMKKIGGDYDQRALAALVNTPRLIGQVVSEYQEKARDRRAIVFAVSVAHSKALEAEFRRRNIKAIHIDGRASAKVRDAALEQVASGEVEVLCNVNLFTEGWDCRAVSCVIMARPTASLTLYLQCVGRGMRPDPASGKTNLIILDHAGNIARHGMPDENRDWSLESRTQREKREAETAELERIYALGYESLEQYRLEECRLLNESYPSSIVQAMLAGYSNRRDIAPFLRAQFNIRKVVDRSRSMGRLVRYNKSDIDGAMQILRNTYSASETDALSKSAGFRFPDQCDWPSYLPRIFPAHGKKNATRFWKSDIDQLVKHLAVVMETSYSAAECRVFFKRGRSGLSDFLRRRSVSPVFGIGSATRYSKQEIDAIRNSPAHMSPREAAKILNISQGHMYSLVKKAGIKLTGGGFPRAEMEALISRLEGRSPMTAVVN